MISIEWWHALIIMFVCFSVGVAFSLAVAAGRMRELSELTHEEEEFHGDPLDKG